MSRIVLGLLGPRCRHDARKRWNAFLASRGIDGFFDFYRTLSRVDLELRLSEMFLHGRRGYLLDASLQLPVCDLLDHLAPSARKGGRADVVVNDGGVLTGHLVGKRGGEWPMENVLALWV